MTCAVHLESHHLVESHHLAEPAAYSRFGGADVELMQVYSRGDLAPDHRPPSRTWSIVSAGRVVGQISLDYVAAEFEPALSKYCPAVRLVIDHGYRGRGLGTEALRQLIVILKTDRFERPLMAAHAAGDSALSHLLSAAGFIHTGCRSRAANGHEMRHMIRIL